MRRSNQLILKETRELVSKGVKKSTPKNADLILADISGSMGSPAMGGKSRWECLQLALAPFKGRAHVLAFESEIHEVDCDALPRPRGTTQLTEALRFAIGLEPIHVLVMCDGAPNNAQTALAAASELAQQCLIDTIYIGPPTDQTAIDFMRELAAVGHGRFAMFDLASTQNETLMIGVEIMLALPAPDSVVKL